MKIKWLTLFALFTLLSCDLSFQDVSSSGTYPVRLILSFSGGYELSGASYTFTNLSLDEQVTGTLDYSNSTGSVFGEAELEEGYWEGYITISKTYDGYTGMSFKISTSEKTCYVKDSEDQEIQFSDPFSEETIPLYANMSVYEMINYDYLYTDQARLWMESLDGRNSYSFDLYENESGYFSRYGDYIQKGEYTVRMMVNNPGHPEWNPDDWDAGLTLASPYFYSAPYDYGDGYSSELDVYTYFNYDYAYYTYYYNLSNNYCYEPKYPPGYYDIFFPGTGDLYFDGYSLSMTATDQAATLSLETLPVGQNRIIEFTFMYNSLANTSEPIMAFYFKENNETPENRLEVKIRESDIVFSSVENNEETLVETYTFPTSLMSGYDYTFKLFIKDGRIGFYNGMAIYYPDFTATIDSSPAGGTVSPS